LREEWSVLFVHRLDNESIEGWNTLKRDEKTALVLEWWHSVEMQRLQTDALSMLALKYASQGGKVRMAETTEGAAGATTAPSEGAERQGGEVLGDFAAGGRATTGRRGK